MPQLGAWLLSIAPGLVSQVLVALGISVITVGGVTVVIGQLKDQFTTRMYALPPQIFDLFMLSGGGVALGMMLGALTTRIVFSGLSAGKTYFGKNTGS